MLVALMAAALSAEACADEVDLGGSRTRLALTTAVSYTDNFYYEAEGADAVAGFLLKPEFNYLLAGPKADLDLALGGEYGMFDTTGSEDNYLDGLAALRFGWRPTLRNSFRLNAGFHHGHDPFGVERTEGSATANTELDQWDEIASGVRYRYGAPGARVHAEIGVSTLDRQYVTNEPFTRFLDYDTTAVEYGLAYNYSPKTAAVLSFTRTDVEFDTPFDNNAGPGGADLDHRGGEIYQVRAGVRWLATAKTSGDVRVGYRQRMFEQIADELEGLDWQAGVQWNPRPPTVIEVRTGRSEQQSYRFDANVIDQKHAAIDLKQSLSSRNRVHVGLEQVDADFFGSGRDDTTRTARLGFERLALQQLYLVLNVAYTNRDSSISEREYDRLHAFAGVRLGRADAR